MKKYCLPIGVIGLCIAVALFIPLAIQAAPDSVGLAGTWQCVSHGGDQGTMPFTLTFQQDGQNISGHVSSQLGDADFDGGTFKNNHLHFVIQGDGDSYDLNAIYKDGKLTGAWTTTVSGKKGTWEGSKAAKQ